MYGDPAVREVLDLRREPIEAGSGTGREDDPLALEAGAVRR